MCEEFRAAQILNLRTHQEDGGADDSELSAVEHAVVKECYGDAYAAAHRHPAAEQHSGCFAGEAENTHDRRKDLTDEREKP